MIDKEKIESQKKIILVGMLGFSRPCIMLRLVIIAMAFTFHKSIGSLEAIIFSTWPPMLISAFNMLLVFCGLICRYISEFGEVSNTYHFTVLNVSFQVIMLALVSTVVCLLERKRN